MIQTWQSNLPQAGAPGGWSTAKTLGVATLTTAVLLAVPPTARLVRRTVPGGDARSNPPPRLWSSNESRTLHGSAAMLATSVLADSGAQHYRGSFKNPGMYTPLFTSGLTILAGMSGATGNSHPQGQKVRRRIYGAAVAVGAAGTAFHCYNAFRRPGGLSWLNLFYGAPLAAPAALSFAGLLGLAASRIEATPKSRPAKFFGLPAGRTLAAMTGLGLAGTSGEAGLLHFRGAFQNPFMFAPVTVPPVASALLLKAALFRKPGTPAVFTRSWLGLTALVGLAGVALHAFGVSRAMGGWRNWSQNLLNGPPLPAPPSFTSLAIAGFAAMSLVEREHG